MLLGDVDSRRRVVWIGLALPSPPDSVEWPDMYIRGAEGLRADVDRLHALSGGQLSYVGEWHSHPSGAAVAPSDTDRAAFAILREVMRAEGLPTVMMIQGDLDSPGLLIE